MASLERRLARMPAKKGEVKQYVQRQFDSWGRRQTAHEPTRLLLLGVGAALIATVMAVLILLVLLVPRLRRLEAITDAATSRAMASPITSGAPR
jgi:hypothetical protein